MYRWTFVPLALLLASTSSLHAEERAASLRGSPAAMQEQNRVARDHGLTFYRTRADVEKAIASKELVPLPGNDDYEVASFVTFPYLQPAAALFVERLASQYRAACGQKLVVTSGVRPAGNQPSNAHALSVHPAGMAVDLRVSDRAACRSWLEDTMLSMERQGLINGIRERNPPHYHIAVFPTQYMAYAERKMAEEAALLAEAEAAAPAADLARVSDGASALVAAESAGAEAAADGERTRTSGRYLALAAAMFGLPFGFGWFNRRRSSILGLEGVEDE